MDTAIQEQPATSDTKTWQEPDEQMGVLRNLFEGGEILPSQLPSASHWTPEIRLAAAVLGQAMADIRWRRADGRDHIQVNAALRWVRSNDGEWMYSFLRICEVLHLEPAWVRGRVHRWLRGSRDNGRAVVRQAA